jgi:hypothetical protein
VFRIPISEFQARAKYLLIKIKSNSGTFSVPEIEEFMQVLIVFHLKQVLLQKLILQLLSTTKEQASNRL